MNTVLTSAGAGILDQPGPSPDRLRAAGRNVALAALGYLPDTPELTGFAHQHGPPVHPAAALFATLVGLAAAGELTVPPPPDTPADDGPERVARLAAAFAEQRHGEISALARLERRPSVKVYTGDDPVREAIFRTAPMPVIRSEFWGAVAGPRGAESVGVLDALRKGRPLPG